MESGSMPNEHSCNDCYQQSIVDHCGIHYCRHCFVLEFGVGPFAIRFQPDWMSMFRTETEIIGRDYLMAPNIGRSSIKQGTCLCGPNRTDPNRDCPVHQPEHMTFGLDLDEWRRGGLD